MGCIQSISKVQHKLSLKNENKNPKHRQKKHAMRIIIHPIREEEEENKTQSKTPSTHKSTHDQYTIDREQKISKKITPIFQFNEIQISPKKKNKEIENKQFNLNLESTDREKLSENSIMCKRNSKEKKQHDRKVVSNLKKLTKFHKQMSLQKKQKLVQNDYALTKYIIKILNKVTKRLPKYQITEKYLKARKLFQIKMNYTENPAPIIQNNIKQSIIMQRRFYFKKRFQEEFDIKLK